jgi:hypothetical protein
MVAVDAQPLPQRTTHAPAAVLARQNAAMPLVLVVDERRVPCLRTSIPLGDAARIIDQDVSNIRSAIERGELEDVSFSGWRRVDPEEFLGFIERGISAGAISSEARRRFADFISTPAKQ